MNSQSQSQQPLSLQALIQERQSSTFVGREEFIESFKSNLSLKPSDSRRKFLFHVWGQGGIGKSFLLKKFERIIQDNQGTSCYTDEDSQEIPKILNRLIQQLDKTGSSFKKFKGLYKIYQQKREEIESDPESPRGLTSLIGKAIAIGAFDIAGHVPILKTASALVDEKAISDKIGDWTSYLMRKLTNKDEVKLLLSPHEVLTPIFTEELRNIRQEYNCIGIIFDTFELTKPYIEDWLRNLLKGSFGELPINTIFITAGRSELDKNYWAQYESIIASYALQPFTKEECTEFLRRKNIVNERIVNLVMNLSSNIPLLVATLAVGENESWDMLGDPSDTAVERFLKWVDESEKRKLALHASLLRRLNKDLIIELIRNDNSEDLFTWLKSMPFIQKRSTGWAYHNVVREQMVRYKRRESLSEFNKIHEIFSSYYESTLPKKDNIEQISFTELEFSNFAEFIYHRLSSNPDCEIDGSLKIFLLILKQSERSALKVAESILQVGIEQENQNVIQIGNLLCDGLNFTKSDSKFNKDARIQMVDELLKTNSKDGWLHADKAHTFHMSRQYRQALDNYKKSVELGYKNHWIFERIGEVLSNLGELKEALEYLSLSEDNNRRCPSCFFIKAETYNLLGDYDEAIFNIDISISLASNHHTSYRVKGEILFNQEKYSQALGLLEEAVEKAPECFTCLSRKAKLNHEIGNLSTALSDYEKLLEIGHESSYIMIEKGKIYQEMGQFQQALESFNLATEIEKNDLKGHSIKPYKIQRSHLPEDIFEKRNKIISRKRAYKQSLKTLREFGIFAGVETIRFLIACDEDHVMQQESSSFWENHKDLLRAKPFLHKAFLCQKMGRFEAALDNVNRAISIAGSDYLYSCRGRIFLQARKFKDAFEDFRKSLLCAINEISEAQVYVDSSTKILHYLPNNFNYCQLIYEFAVSKIKFVGFDLAREDAAIVMRKLIELTKSDHSDDKPFILYFISGLYALALMDKSAIHILGQAIEDEPFLYSLACHDIAWENFWDSPSFKCLNPSEKNRRMSVKGFSS